MVSSAWFPHFRTGIKTSSDEQLWKEWSVFWLHDYKTKTALWWISGSFNAFLVSTTLPRLASCTSLYWYNLYEMLWKMANWLNLKIVVNILKKGKAAPQHSFLFCKKMNLFTHLCLPIFVLFDHRTQAPVVSSELEGHRDVMVLKKRLYTGMPSNYYIGIVLVLYWQL